MSQNYGQHTGHSVGIIMKELMRRAIGRVSAMLVTFQTESKVGIDGREDVLTTADREAQQIYVRSLRECFPGFGLIGEEDRLNHPCTIPSTDAFFTVDPVDGTRALVRRQSHGIGTMISLVINGVVVSAYVGDIMTGEIYGFRPESTHVHRISRYELGERLLIDPELPLSRQYALLHGRPESLPECAQAIVATDGAFRGIEVQGGSIGTTMARLWKGEVGAMMLEPSHMTLWDMCPIWGISQVLGFCFLQLPDLTEFDYRPGSESSVERTDHSMIVLHRSRVEELRSFRL